MLALVPMHLLCFISASEYDGIREDETRDEDGEIAEKEGIGKKTFKVHERTFWHETFQARCIVISFHCLIHHFKGDSVEKYRKTWSGRRLNLKPWRWTDSKSSPKYSTAPDKLAWDVKGIWR